MPMANGNAERPIIHLPAWMTKEWVYHLYIEECQEGKENGECLERTCVINGNEQLSFRNYCSCLYGRISGFITDNETSNIGVASP